MTAYPFLEAFTGIRNGSNYVLGLVFSYDAAHEEAREARRLLSEMMTRTAQRGELLAENERLQRMANFVRSEPRLTLEPARAIVNCFKGIITIDQGTLHGVRDSVCVVTEDGIVGFVSRADLASSTVVTLYNADCRVGAMILRNRVRGVVYGNGSQLSRYCTMNYIDMKDDVREHDVVVTCPGSAFPAGYPIGTVVAVHAEPGSLWKSAEIMPAVDPYRLDEVFLLRREAPAPGELTGATPPSTTSTSPASDLAAASVAPATPDKRTLQERYAP